MVIEKISAYVFYRMLWRDDTSLLNENRAGVCFFKVVRQNLDLKKPIFWLIPVSAAGKSYM